MESKRNIWIVAFAFAPNKRVGAMRATYWYKHLGNAVNANVSVITGEEEAEGANIHVVKKQGSSWMTKFIQDDGVVWKQNIKNYLENDSVQKPDVVIITGGPFMHFSLGKWMKKKYGCKIILDYRDPFAINPGFNNSKLKIEIKKWFERKFNKQADGLITVNPYCGKIIESFFDKKHKIIQNGFDESTICEPKPVELGNEMSCSYAGKFYFSPAHMEEALQRSKVKMTYVGGNEDMLNPKNPYVDSKGFVTYEEALEVVGNADVGIIQTIGHEFQSTTKIFDYVRCSRAILVISNDQLKTGGIHQELVNYPNVFWTKNNQEDIYNAIEEIKEANYQMPPEGFSDKYSRGSQLRCLVELLEEIG